MKFPLFGINCILKIVKSVPGHLDRIPILYFFILTIILGTISYFSASLFDKGFNYLYLIPFGEGLTIAPILDAGVDWIWETFFYYLNILSFCFLIVLQFSN